MSQIFITTHPLSEPKYGRVKIGVRKNLPWNTSHSHYRKYIKRHGQYLSYGKVCEGELYFWGEYEPPTTCTIINKVVPKAIHDQLYPVRSTIVPPNALNTDPYVFGDHFKHICCGIRNRNFQVGDVILFGKIEENKTKKTHFLLLDTVVVVKEKVQINPLLNKTQYYKAAIEPMNSKKEFFYRGENFSSGEPYYSFVPCLLEYSSQPWPCLDLKKLGFTVKKGWRTWKADEIPFTHKRWEMIQNAVIKRGWLIGTHINKI